MKVDYIGYGSREYELVVDARKNTKQNIVFDKKEVSIKSKIDWF
jgi:hypothetical protein